MSMNGTQKLCRGSRWCKGCRAFKGIGGFSVKGVWGWGSRGRTKVKSLKISTTERTGNCESLLEKITFPNYFKEKHISSFDRPGCEDADSINF